jgi:hypothetical protein
MRPPPAARRGIAVAIGLGYAAVLLAVYPDVWAPWRERRLFGWDALDSYWPDLVFQIRAWRDGEAPLWNPFDRGGYPFWADPQAALWSPLSWLVVGIGVATGSDGPWLMQLKALLHLWLAGAGMHLYLRRGRGLSHAASLAGGLAFAIGGPLVFHKNGAMLWPWALAPFGLLAIEHFARRRSHVAGALLGGALALPVVSGFPPSAFYFAIVAGPYLLVRAFAAPPRRSTVAPLLTAAAVFGTLVAPVVVPAALHLPLLARGERTVGYATGQPLPWRDLIGFAWPWGSTHGIYVGALPLLGMLAAWRRRDAALGTLLACGLLGLGLALGAQTPVLPWLAEHVAPFRLFRIAYRYRVIPCLAICVIGAHGLDALLDLVRGRARAALGVCLPLCCAADLRVAHAERMALLESPRPHPSQRERAVLVSGAGRDDRIFDEWQLFDRAGSRLGLRDFRGRSKDPMSLARYQDVVTRLDRAPGLLAVFGVRHYLAGPHYRSGRAPAWIQDPRRHTILRSAGQGVYEVDAWPRVFWTDRVHVETDGRRALDRLARLAAEPRARAAIVERGDMPPGARDALSRQRGERFAAGHVVEFARNRVVAEIDAPAAGLVVLNEVWTPDWTLAVDGRAAPVFRAHTLMRGAWVEAGRHVLEFRFRPPALRLLAPLFALGLCVVVAAALRRSR